MANIRTVVLLLLALSGCAPRPAPPKDQVSARPTYTSPGTTEFGNGGGQMGGGSGY